MMLGYDDVQPQILRRRIKQMAVLTGRIPWLLVSEIRVEIHHVLCCESKTAVGIHLSIGTIRL